jgi:hypothetical protein
MERDRLKTEHDGRNKRFSYGARMIFNEDSRVKIPALLHCVRLGYGYLPLKDAVWDKETNLLTEIFDAAVLRLNPDVPASMMPGVRQETTRIWAGPFPNGSCKTTASG